MIIPYGANIWDLSNYVGISNVISVVKYTDSWDSDLSDLWVKEVDLIKQDDIEIIEYTPTVKNNEFVFVANSNQSIYDLSLQLYADVSKCLLIGKGLDDLILIGEKYKRVTNDFVKIFTDKIIKDKIIYSTDISILDTNNNEETFNILTESINPILTEDNNNLTWI